MNNSYVHNNSLSDDDKDTFLNFVAPSEDLIEATTESVLSKAIDLFKRVPELAKVDVSGATRQSWLIKYFPTALGVDFRLLAVHVLLLAYGKPVTNVETDLALRFLIVSTSGLRDQEMSTLVELGVDFVPSEGWSPLGIALICQCHPSLIEYLLLNTRSPSCLGYRWPSELLAAILGRQFEFAKSIQEAHSVNCHSCLVRLRSPSHRFPENAQLWMTLMDILLLLPEVDWVMDFFQMILETHPALARPSVGYGSKDGRLLKFHNVASPRKADLITTFLADKKIEELWMNSRCWTVDGLLRLMSNLGDNSNIRRLSFHVPDHLVWDERIQTNLVLMLRKMESLQNLYLDLSEDSWLNNQCTFGALADAFPECKVQVVRFLGDLKFTNEPSLTSLYGGSAFEKILNNVRQLWLCTVDVQENLFELVARGARFSPTLEKIVFYDCDEDFGDFLFESTCSSCMPRPQCREKVSLEVTYHDKFIPAFDRLAAAFKSYNVCFDEVQVRCEEPWSHPTHCSSMRTFISISKVAKIWFSSVPREHQAIIDDICCGIRSAQYLAELSLDVTFCEASSEVTQQVFDVLAEDIARGKLTKLRCPLSLVRHHSDRLASAWTKLTRLKIKTDKDSDYSSCVGDDDWYNFYEYISEVMDEEVPRPDPVKQFGEDLIKLTEESTTLVELFTDFHFHKDQASLLRHRIVCNHASAHQVHDVENASIATVVSVLSRVNESLKKKRFYSFQCLDGCTEWDGEFEDRENEPKNNIGPLDELSRVSAAFDVLLRSATLVACWCKENRWRWEKKHELETAQPYMFDSGEKKDQGRDSKRPRLDVPLQR